ncbi:MAG TPA: glycosyltransferase family 4 protein [Caldilineaceae bacterium]|nr:glycosyltransferase family 4 protein [Caldilineaceae bacterium]
MKILLISNGFPSRQWAGTETYTAGIAQELQRRGHHVQVLCGGQWHEGPAYWNGFTDETYKGVRVRRLNVNWTNAPDPFLYLYNNPVTARFLASYLDQLQPDLVHVTSCERLSASVLSVVKQAGLPLVLSLTDFWFLCPRITLLRHDGENCDGDTTPWECTRCLSNHAKIYRWPRRVLPEVGVAKFITTLSRFPQLTRQPGLRGMVGDVGDRKAFLSQAFQWPDHRVTASSFVRSVFESNGFEAPITVQPYGHDLAWLAAYPGKAPSRQLRIGFIGQIVGFKGVHLLLEAVRSLRARFGDRFTLSIYGNLDKLPAYSDRLRSMAADLPNVTFCGTYAHEQSGRVFSSLDVLVVPSLWYDFPLIIFEAFATNTPVIATNLGGMAEAVTHEVNGLLFERGDAADLSGQLARLINEPGLLERLKSNTPAVKTVADEVSQLESVYTELTPRMTQRLCVAPVYGD